MVFIRRLLLLRMKGNRKITAETRGGCGVQRLRILHNLKSTCSYTVHALHAKVLAHPTLPPHTYTLKNRPNTNTDMHFLTRHNQSCQHSGCFQILPVSANQSPASTLRATKTGSPFVHVWEAFALDALSSGICSVSL